MKRKLGILVFLCALLCLLPLTAGAFPAQKTEPPQAGWLEADVEQIRAGGTVTLTFSLAEMPEGTPGVNAVAGKISYDHDGFTLLSGPEAQGKWTLPSYVSAAGSFAGYRTEGGTQHSEPVWTAVFQAQDSLQPGEQEFRVSASYSDGAQTCRLENETLRIPVVSSGTPKPSPTGTPTAAPTGTPGPSPTAGPTARPEPSANPSAKPSPTAGPTAGPEPSASPSAKPSPTAGPGTGPVPPSGPGPSDEPPAPAHPVLRLDHTGPYLHGYPDHTLRPETGITREEASVLLFGLADQLSGPSGEGFRDVPGGAWSAEAIAGLSGSGILHGYPDGEFHPQASITRAEFVSVLVRFFEPDGAQAGGFPDLRSHWAEKDLRWAAAQGWIKGLPDGSFAPERAVTRAEACAILNRVLKRQLPGQVPSACQWADLKLDQWYTADMLAAAGA